MEVGDKFGMLVVVKANIFKDKHRRWIHEVKCECGTHKQIASGTLYHAKSCGCWRRERFFQVNKNRRIKLEKNQTFGRLTVEKYVGQGGPGKGTQYLCSCACGNQKIVSASRLTRGADKSCGCLKTPNPVARRKRKAERESMQSALLYDSYVKATIQKRSKVLKFEDIPSCMVETKRIYLANLRMLKGL